jgi:N-acetylglucosaminyldiphosphoundecaprenol N-acetyl-beta-D-mannosaminyltransferase
MDHFLFSDIKCSIATIPDVLEAINSSISNHTSLSITCINAHIFNLQTKSRNLQESINECDIVCADGMSVVWLSPLFKTKLKERCNMTDIFSVYLNSDIPKHNCILVGCSTETGEKARNKIHTVSKNCNVVDCISGYLDFEQYENILRKKYSNIDCIFVGMGSPKSELFISVAKKICTSSLIWHIGGGTINFLSGEIKEAPLPLRKTGLQWLHRFYCEPRKMWKRYLLGNPEFLLRIFLNLFLEYTHLSSIKKRKLQKH